MSKVKLDRIEGAQLTQNETGYELIRVAYVSGLGGEVSDRLHQALGVAGVPRMGQRHPTISDLSVVHLQVEPDGPHAAVITIRYQGRKRSARLTGEVSVGSTLSQQLTEVDASGKRITVSYQSSDPGSTLQTQGVRVSVLQPQSTLVFKRNQPDNPAALARAFVGTVNRTRIFDSEAQTWLCSAISGKSTDGGRSFDVTYEFQHNAEGWQPRVSYVDPQTNRPPPDLAEGIGSKQVDLYRVMDFKELGLT